jgi:hypothetical protein
MNNFFLNNGVYCHLTDYDKSEVDYSDFHSIDLIAGRAKKTAEHVLKTQGYHTPTFIIFGTMHPLMEQGCDCHGWILSGSITPESEVCLSDLVQWTKQFAEKMKAYCIVSCGEILLNKDSDDEALNIQIEHAMEDRRIIAKFHRNKRNCSLLDWERLDNPEPPLDKLKGMLPVDPIFANAEEV